MPDNWEWFIKNFEFLSHIDLTAYKRPQMERRINSFMRSASVPDYNEFISLLKTDANLYRKFLDHITINVSEFFRNANHWEILEKQVIPDLIKDRSGLRVWSAGCSTGEEPYSLAMMLKENRVNLVDKILATDLDQEVLAKAAQGIYSAKSAQGIPPAYLSKYFTAQDENYEARDELKDMIKFQGHNLLKDGFGKDFDLILCRNVVIYFTEETKSKLYQRFADAMRPGGILFIGSTEQIFQARDLGLKSVATFFYKKES
ncbi:MAG: protein-glutamate O-methyltransferase CheR [Syntrophomonadaceae bacterium]|nr:protein-glutamate O-methyltransferase CheR [Syntrophomonadaceae bacterium]